MAWFNLYDEVANSATQPRFLTEEEIDNITDSAIPYIPSMSRLVANTTRVGIIEQIKSQLYSVQIPPTAEVISSLTDYIRERYEASKIKSGEMVGNGAADAASSTVLQMSLDLFHFSGTGENVTLGVNDMKQILYATTEIKNPVGIVHFNIPVTLRDVIDMRAMFDERTVMNFAEKDGVDYLSKEDDTDSSSVFHMEQWHEDYLRLTDEDLEDWDYCLRIKLNVTELYAHKVTPVMIKNVIDSEKIYLKIQGNSYKPEKTVNVIPSPTNIGIIDIFPIMRNIRKNLIAAKIDKIENPGILFLRSAVVPQLEKLKVKGIPGVKEIYPIHVIIQKNILPSRNPSDAEITTYGIDSLAKGKNMKNVWINDFDMRYIKSKSIESHKLLNLMMSSKTKKGEKIEILAVLRNSGGDDTGVVSYSEKSDPKTIVTTFITENKDNREVVEMDNYVYAMTRGMNLKSFYKIPIVDTRKTYSKNMHEILKLYGIEACRKFIALTTQEIIASSGSINSRHISLISDYICNRGIPYGVTYSGTSRQQEGFASSAMQGSAMTNFTSGALHQSVEKIEHVYVGVMVGAEIQIGENAKFIAPTQKDVADMRKKYEEKIHSKPLMVVPNAKQFVRDISYITDIVDQGKMGVIQGHESVHGQDIELLYPSSERKSKPKKESSLIIKGSEGLKIDKPGEKVPDNLVISHGDVAVIKELLVPDESGANPIELINQSQEIASGVSEFQIPDLYDREEKEEELLSLEELKKSEIRKVEDNIKEVKSKDEEFKDILREREKLLFEKNIYKGKRTSEGLPDLFS